MTSGMQFLRGISRREFIQLSSAFAGLSLLKGVDALAALDSGPPHMLLVLRAKGGWDVIMGPDAKPPEAVRKAGIKDGEYLFIPGRTPAKNHGQTYLAPAMSSLFPYMSDIAIVNGIMMNEGSEDLGQNLTYMSAGTSELSFGYIPYQFARVRSSSRDNVADATGDDVTGGYGRTVKIGALKPGASEISDSDRVLLQVAKEIEKQGGELDSQMALLLEQDRELATFKRMDVLNRASLAQAFQRGNYLPNVGLALSGLASGYIQGAIANISDLGDLDTHGNHQVRHSTGITMVFDSVATIIRAMKETPYLGPGGTGKTSVFEHTTCVVISDFSRSSWPENIDGASHNQICNSALVFGRGIAGGAVAGQSEILNRGEVNRGAPSYLHAGFYDFKSQRPVLKAATSKIIASGGKKSLGVCSADGCVDYIYPETLWRTVAQAMGIRGVPSLGPGPILSPILKKNV